MDTEDAYYIEWFTTVNSIDFNDDQYRNEILIDFNDDLTKLISILLDDTLSDDEFNIFIEDAMDTIFKFGCVFLIKFEQYEQFEDAHKLHTVLTEMLKLIYVTFNTFGGDNDECRAYSKEQINIAINIIKNDMIKTLTENHE